MHLAKIIIASPSKKDDIKNDVIKNDVIFVARLTLHGGKSVQVVLTAI